MKKIISCFLIFLLLLSPIYSKDLKKIKKVGLIITMVGLGLTILGFAPLGKETEEIKIDISNPSLDYSNYTWNKTNYGSSTWYTQAQGVVKNTGNTYLKNVKIYIKYYDVNNNLLSSSYDLLDTYWLDPFPINTQDTWSHYDSMIGEPYRIEVSAKYDYIPVYRIEYKEKSVALSPIMGIMGGIVLIYGLGMYLFPQYENLFFSKKIKVQILAKNDNVILRFSKLF